MTQEQNIELYLNTIVNEGLYPDKGNLEFHMGTLFKDINFENKRVLDIGGGSGHHSFYAACKGASKVVCLEPEIEGSSANMIAEFQRLKELLNSSGVTIEPVTLQEFDPKKETFDIILLHNSINHLDEDACIDLLTDSESQNIYQDVFSKMYSLSSDGAKLIVCDCSRYNFFARIKAHNPFAPTIEWHKHQAPEVWANLLENVGFTKPQIQWSTFNTLRSWGRILLGNKFAAYFLTSHFSLTMEKP